MIGLASLHGFRTDEFGRLGECSNAVDGLLRHIIEVVLRHDRFFARARIKHVVRQDHLEGIHGFSVRPGNRGALEGDFRHHSHGFLLDDIAIDASAALFFELQDFVNDFLRIRGIHRYGHDAADEEEKGVSFLIHDFPPVDTVLILLMRIGEQGVSDDQPS